MAAQAGATITQMMPKIAPILHLSIKMGDPKYMEETEAVPQSLDFWANLGFSGWPLWKTDTGKQWMRLSQFTEFRRIVISHGDFKE